MSPVAAPASVRRIERRCAVSTLSPDGWSMVYSYRSHHRWVLEPDRLVFSNHDPAILTRTYRCLHCDTTWTVSGELDPAWLMATL